MAVRVRMSSGGELVVEDMEWESEDLPQIAQFLNMTRPIDGPRGDDANPDLTEAVRAVVLLGSGEIAEYDEVDRPAVPGRVY